MKVLAQKSLRSFNSFAIDVNADLIIEAESIDDLIGIWSDKNYQTKIKLPLGRGSNTLFCNDFNGIVVLNRIIGKKVIETETDYLLSVSSGEDWPSFVKWCVDHNYNGIENLAMIPGCVGSAPIQNIGAYGVELKDICDYVEFLDLMTLKVKRLNRDECRFGYRDSIFKGELKDKVVITSVGFKLTKKWTPKLTYGPLINLQDKSPTSLDIFNQICAVRSEKLPDPEVIGNAGSFFKNPIISEEKFTQLTRLYPELPIYSTAEGKKVAAGWLIDNAGLKGFSINDAQVHEKQALVIINKGNASADDIVGLAYYVQKTILEYYGIKLEHEVRFYRFSKEILLEAIFSEK